MTAAAPARLPIRALTAGFRRFSVAEYQRLTDIGILTENDNVELLDGYLVNKMAKNPPHDGTVDLLCDLLSAALVPGWVVRNQNSLVLPGSVPEPDAAVVRGTRREYLARHPVPADVAVVAEVANSTLDSDRGDKLPLYARAAIPTYWIVNVLDRVVEVYSDPDPAAGAYRVRRDYAPGETVPILLDGAEIGGILVGELFP